MVSLTLFQSHLDINIDSSLLAYQNFYKNFDNISIIENFNSQIIPEKMNGRDDLEIYISKPSKEYIIVSAIYDNLGKGSAGSIAKLVEEIHKEWLEYMDNLPEEIKNVLKNIDSSELEPDFQIMAGHC